MEEQKKIFIYDKPFELESGEILPGLTIAYHTYGKLNAKKDNCIWVCHALTANSDVADWWPHTVEKGGFLDPEKYFVVCANIIGSCYGSTGPLSINETTNTPYYDKFPKLTIRDMVKAHILLAAHLGIENVFSLIGSSVGGFQAIEWAVMQPEMFKSLVLIATSPKATPWTIAIDETQRMAILADKTYGEPREDAAKSGLAAARAIGLLTYRGAEGYNLTQQNHDVDMNCIPDTHRACTYQRYQGEKLVNRFDAYSYVTILDAFDTHDIGRSRGGVENALLSLSMPVLSIGITTDILFTPAEMRDLSTKISKSEYKEIESAFGHDGFLVEYEKLNKLINDFFESVHHDD